MGNLDFQTGQDLLLYALKNGGQAESTSDTYATDVKQAILTAYWTIMSMEEWPWAKATQPKVVTTLKKVSGTVSSISTADPAVVTVSANITDSMALRKFYMDSNQSYYRIASHSAGTASLTLDAAYVDTPSTGIFTIYQDEYALATDVIVPWSPMRLRGQFEGNIDLMDQAEFEARYSVNTSQVGLTDSATIMRYSLDGADQSPLIRVAPWTEDRINIEYDYTQRHVLTFDNVASTDTPRVPRELRWVIGDWAIWRLWMNKNDGRATAVGKSADAGIAELKNRFRSTQGKTRSFVRPRYSMGVR